MSSRAKRGISGVAQRAEVPCFARDDKSCDLGPRIVQRRGVRPVWRESSAPIHGDHLETDLLTVDVDDDVVKRISAGVARRTRQMLHGDSLRCSGLDIVTQVW